MQYICTLYEVYLFYIFQLKSGVGNWPLFLAVENGHLEIVRLLCQVKTFVYELPVYIGIVPTCT